LGHQGLQVPTSGNAGGRNVYGGSIAYYPTADWTIKGSVDETINISSQTLPSIQAISLPVATPVQIPLSASTNITATTLRSDLRLTPEWSTTRFFGFTRIQYLGSSTFDNSWVADVTLSYDILRNLTLTWEYQYLSIFSDVPLSSATRNLIATRASYRF
jgi:hypothetical protein